MMAYVTEFNLQILDAFRRDIKEAILKINRPVPPSAY